MSDTIDPSKSDANPDSGQATSGCLNSHRILTFAGKDAATFLQGYLTCDTQNLASHKALPGAFTNLKGRVVANGWVWGESTLVKMLIAESLTVTVDAFLAPYLNFSRTKLSIAQQPPEVSFEPGDQLIQLGSGKYLSPTVDENKEDVSAQWLQACISSNEAVVTAPTSGTYLPQMLGLTDLGGVSFDKGCYLGQEVVARAEHRGEVKRRLKRASYEFSSESNAAQLAPNDVLTHASGAQAGKRAGNVICATAGSVLLVSSAEPIDTQHWLRGETEITLDFS